MPLPWCITSNAQEVSKLHLNESCASCVCLELFEYNLQITVLIGISKNTTVGFLEFVHLLRCHMRFNLCCCERINQGYIRAGQLEETCGHASLHNESLCFLPSLHSPQVHSLLAGQ